MSEDNQLEDIGRQLLLERMHSHEGSVSEAFYSLIDAYESGKEPTEEEIREARMAMNEARRFLEEFAAPSAGVEPWSSNPPPMHVGDARRFYGGDVDEGDSSEE